MITPTLILPHQREKSFLKNWMPRSSAAGYFTPKEAGGSEIFETGRGIEQEGMIDDGKT